MNIKAFTLYHFFKSQETISINTYIRTRDHKQLNKGNSI